MLYGTGTTSRKLCLLSSTTCAWSYCIDSNVTLGSWQHIAVKTNGTHAIFYINGTEVGNSIFTIGATTTESLKIGVSRPVSATDYFNGTIDEVMIFNRTLTAGEISELYQSSVSAGTQTNFTFTENNAGDSDVSYDFYRNGTVAGMWHFDEGSGTLAIDDTGNADTGFFANGTAGPASCPGAACPLWVAGKYGTALQFDGKGKYLFIRHPGEAVSNPDWVLQPTSHVTMEAWVKIPTTATQYGGIIGCGGDQYWESGYELNYDAGSNYLEYRLGYSSDEVPDEGEEYYMGYTVNLKDNQWRPGQQRYERPRHSVQIYRVRTLQHRRWRLFTYLCVSAF
jgi:hypothetical protein